MNSVSNMGAFGTVEDVLGLLRQIRDAWQVADLAICDQSIPGLDSLDSEAKGGAEHALGEKIQDWANLVLKLAGDPRYKAEAESIATRASRDSAFYMHTLLGGEFFVTKVNAVAAVVKRPSEELRLYDPDNPHGLARPDASGILAIYLARADYNRNLKIENA